MKTKLFFLFLLISYSLSSQIIYVDQNATGSNNGTDWANAYTDLQTAIANLGSNTTINVAQGTYYPTATTDRTIYFNIPRDKKLFGGFPTGGGTRDPELNPTVLSGDIGTIGDNTDNSYHVVYFNNSSSTNEFDGFIVEKGYANGSGSYENSGGGVLVTNSSSSSYGLYLRNCIIRYNYAINGGGITISKKADIYNCKIYSNQAEQTAGGISINTDGRIYNSYITNNSAGGSAGGLYITGFNTAPKAIGCVIANNESGSDGAGARVNSYLINCTVVNNKGNYGVMLDTYGGILNCILWKNETTSSQVYIPGSSTLENNLIQDFTTSGTNLGISTSNNGTTIDENYPRFTKPTSFTGNATNQTELDEILNADWSINPQSAAINFGDNSLYPSTDSRTPTTDFIGNNRTINSTMDAGAYESLTNIITNQATNQQLTSVDLNGKILFAETSNTILRGFVYATTSDFDVTTATSVTNSATGLGTYTDNITGLTENQLYYFRTWAQFDGTKYYGNEIQFKASNLVAYYPFNGNANDESGNENNGTLNGATLTTDRFGNSDSAYYFDGTSNYISIADNPNINIQTSESFSISFWAKHDAPNNAIYMISKYKGSSGEPSYAIGTGSIGDSYSWYEFSPGGIENRGTIDLNDNNWHNITSVFKSGESVSIYVDGILDISHPVTHAGSIINSRNLTIGCGSNIAQFYKGSIDDVKIYKKALTPEEIKNEVNGLVAYYPFNGNANDESGNANNGTVSGATLTPDRFGNANSAYSFNGTNNYIQCLSPGPIGSSPRTISFWAKTSLLPSVHSNVVLSYGGDAGSFNYGDRIEISLNSNNRYGLVLSLGGGILIREFNNNDNNWHHYTVVFDGGVGKTLSDFKMYADGNLLTNTTYLTGDSYEVNTSNNYPIQIGNLPNSSRYFNGDIDEVKIFNKAITDTEVLNLYNTGSLGIEDNQLKHANTFYVFNNILYFGIDQNLSEIKNISIFNLLAQNVFESDVIQKETVLNFLGQGIYILKVEFNNGSIGTKKILIQ